MTKVLDILRLLRPGQWIKNLFVLTAIVFSGKWIYWETMALGLQVFILFSMLSSSVYCLNDIADLNYDKNHPIKKNRPLAAGKIKLSTGYILFLGLLILPLLLAYTLELKLFLVLTGYFVLNVLYTFYLKKMVLLDVFCISFGFLLRILAGSWAIGISPSQWFILCTLMLSLYLALCKRYGELVQSNSHSRPVLADYSKDLLQLLIGVSLSATLITYGLYTVSGKTVEVHHTENLIYTFPIVAFGLFRYTYLVLGKHFGEDTALDLWRDRLLAGTVFSFVICFVAISK